MKFCVIASGSKGNCTYISTEYTNILIDIGISCANVEKKLSELDVNSNSIDAVVLTHTHNDHINGLRVFIKKHNPKLYLTKKMYDELSILFPIINYEIITGDFNINDVDFTVFKTSHDSPDSNGYILESNKKSLVYITDTGYINSKYFEKLKNKSAYIIESNHDIELLMNGKYPYHLKQRILGDKGHLSNRDTSYYLTKFIGEKTETVVLIHLSEENNKEEVALKTLNNALKKENIEFANIIVSKQNSRTDVINV